MQKDYRLKAMHAWDEATFNEHLGSRTAWGLVSGGPLSGKSLVAKIVADQSKGKVVDMTAMAEVVRKDLDTEEAPFEGRVPDAEVEKAVLAMVEAHKKAGEKFFYLFDGRYHETVEKQAEFLMKNLGAPSQVICCKADEQTVQGRFKEKMEIAEDLGEDDSNALKEKTAAAVADQEALQNCWTYFWSRIQQIEFDTACSKENLLAKIRTQFSAKVILVNHEKRIDVDTECANLAIKYNMLYMSVYQLIRGEIRSATELGCALEQSRREK